VDVPLQKLWVRIPPGSWKSVPCECCVLSAGGLRVRPTTRPEESYRVWCVWVWSWSLDNEQALVHWGLLRYEKGHPITRHNRHRGEARVDTSYPFATRHQKKVGGQHHAPAGLCLERTRQTLYWRLVGHGISRHPPGFDPPAIQPVGSGYTDRAILAAPNITCMLAYKYECTTQVYWMYKDRVFHVVIGRSSGLESAHSRVFGNRHQPRRGAGHTNRFARWISLYRWKLACKFEKKH